MTEKSYKKGEKIFTIIINNSRPINITSILVVAELEAIWEMAEVIKHYHYNPYHDHINYHDFQHYQHTSSCRVGGNLRDG